MTFGYEMVLKKIATHCGICKTSTGQKYKFILSMKQLDVVVSPPAFLWDPYLTLTYEIFDLDICGL